MKKLIIILILLQGVLITPFIQAEDEKETIRLACVGDSITFGSKIKDRENNSYPAQLGKLLGDSYEVKNFGKSGATAIDTKKASYIKTKQCEQALAFKPNRVVIKLGTNDCTNGRKRNFWDKDKYIKDYTTLIKKFQDLESKPKIWLCYPAPAFEDKWEITDKVITEEVIPAIDELAKALDLPIIDMHKPFEEDESLFPDKIHPNAEGAKKMAEIVQKVLTADQKK